MANLQDRRAYRRSYVEVPVELSDLWGVVMGRTADVSRGGLLAYTSDPKPIGTLLRVRVVAADNDAVVAVGVVVRRVAEEDCKSGVAIALTSTSEAWDRFWDDLSPSERTGGQA